MVDFDIGELHVECQAAFARTLTNLRRVLCGSASDLQQDQCAGAILLVLPFSQSQGQEGDLDLAERWPWMLFSRRSSTGERAFPLAVWNFQTGQKSLDLGKSYQCGLGRAVSSVHNALKQLELMCSLP